VSDIELLRRDIHPAEVLLPDGRLLLEARVFVTDRRVLVYKVQDGRIMQVRDLTLIEPGCVTASRSSLNGGRIEVEVLGEHGGRAETGTLIVNQGAGCGCGSPLKAYAPPVPWTGVF
jgi:hypothetical protein